jgi:HEAT repeat protein
LYFFCQAVCEKRKLLRIAIMSADVVQKWIQRLDSSDIDLSIMAAGKLGKMGDRTAVPALIENLRTRTSHIRASCARALGDLGDPAAIPALIEALRDPDPSVSYTAADALAQIGTNKAVPALMQIMKESRSPSHHERLHSERSGMYAVVRNALERIGTPEALDAIKKVTKSFN